MLPIYAIANNVDELNLAAKKGDLESVKRILAENPNYKNRKGSDGLTALHWAIANDHDDIASYLIDQKCDVNIEASKSKHTAICNAARRGNYKITKKLIENGADINVKELPFNYTPIQLAAEYSTKDSLSHDKLIKLLIDNNAEIILKPTDCSRSNFLDYVTFRDRYSLLKYIIEKRNISDTTILNPTFILACGNPTDSIARYLLTFGCNVNARGCKMRQNSPLEYAIYKGRAEMVTFLLKKGAKLDNNKYRNLLEDAIYNKYTNVVNILITDSTDLYELDEYNRTVFDRLLEHNQIDILEELIRKGKYNKPDKLLSDLIYNNWQNRKLVDLIVENGIDVNCKISNRHHGEEDVPLITALYYNRIIEAVVTLIKRGANYDVTIPNEHDSLITTAISRQDVDILDAIVNRKDVSQNHLIEILKSNRHVPDSLFEKIVQKIKPFKQIDSTFTEILFKSTYRNNFDQFKSLYMLYPFVNVTDSYGKTLLMNACERRDSTLFSFLMSENALVDIVDKKGNNAFFYALGHGRHKMASALITHKDFKFTVNKMGDSPLTKAVEDNNQVMIQTILTKLYEIDSTNISSLNKALNIALKNNNFPIVEQLHSFGATFKEINLKEYNDMLLKGALHSNNRKILTELIINGLDCNSEIEIPVYTSIYEEKLLMYKKLNKDRKINFTRFFRAPKIKGNLFHWACQQNDFEMVKLLVSKGVNPSVKNEIDETPIHIAYKNNAMDIFNFLIENGAKIDELDSKSYSIFLKAAKNGQTDIIKQCIEKATFDINHYGDRERKSAIHYASKNGYYSIVKLLVDSKCDMESVDRYGMSPVLIAIENNYIEIVDLLIKSGIDINKYHPDKGTILDFAYTIDNEKIIKLLKYYGAKEKYDL